MYKKVNTIHLVGIGGIGMSSLAHLLLKAQYQVSGSDLASNENIKNLEALGVKCFLEHKEENIQKAELLVYSSAISNQNPELIAAKKKNIPTIPRAEMLAEMMRLKYGIAVAGAHGKTTTTSMIAQVLEFAGLDPTAVVGGKMNNFNGLNAKVGNGEFMVVEADESDGSFHRLSPSIAVITNIDKEHLDYYKTMESLTEAFFTFIEKVPFYGMSVLCGDDSFIKAFLPKISRRKMTYGLEDQNDYRVISYEPNREGSVSVIQTPTSQETLTLKIPGI
jgi:UDP-N-acetylmuramate--alanine ligase